MNCLITSVAKCIGRPNADIYIGVGHGEPIHISEIIAWLLTQGFGLIPRETRDKTLEHFPCMIEGINATGEPHADVIEMHENRVYWYLVPVNVNTKFVLAHQKLRDQWVKENLL